MSEGDLAGIERQIVEYPVTKIISELIKIPAARQHFGLANGVTFENHPNTLSDIADEVQQAMSRMEPVLRLRYADQLCVYKTVGGTRDLRFVVEYKAPHKLSVEHSRRGLRPMNLPSDILNRPTIPTDAESKLDYDSDLRTGAAISQTFGYMIDNGLEYSYITTGEAVVFLRVMEDNPTTIHYHLAEPKHEAEMEGGGARISKTAVGQVLAFCLIALQSSPRSMDWRHAASKAQRTWEVDFEAICRQMPAHDAVPSSPPSASKGPDCPFDRSPG